MARLSLQVELAEDANSICSGSTIRGKVAVTVHEASTGQTLVIATGCRGNAATPRQSIEFLSDTERKTLFSGDWEPGVYRYPFTLTAPDGCTYDGTIMQVDWFVRAGVGDGNKTVWSGGKVTMSSGFAIEDVRPIVLVPGPVSTADLIRKRDSKLNRKEGGRTMTGCLLPSLILLGLGSCGVWLGWRQPTNVPEFLVVLAYYPGQLLLLAGLVAMGITVWQLLIDRYVAASELRIGALVTWPGERVPFRLTLSAKKPLEVKKATLTLTGWEHVKRFTGMTRTTGEVNRHIVHEEVLDLPLPATYPQMAQPVRFAGTFEIPDKALCTQDFDNEVKFLWRVEISVLVKGSPRWFDRQFIAVLPRVTEAQVADSSG